MKLLAAGVLFSVSVLFFFGAGCLLVSGRQGRYIDISAMVDKPTPLIWTPTWARVLVGLFWIVWSAGMVAFTLWWLFLGPPYSSGDF